MSERYWVAGVQLGLLEAFINSGELIKAKDVLNEIFENQFVGNVKGDAKHEIVLIQENEHLGVLTDEKEK